MNREGENQARAELAAMNSVIPQAYQTSHMDTHMRTDMCIVAKGEIETFPYLPRTSNCE